MGNSIPTSKNYTGAKRGLKVQKRFPKYGGKDICENFVLMELINLLLFSSDFTGDINMKNPHHFTFLNTKLQYMSATTPIAAKEN